MTQNSPTSWLEHPGILVLPSGRTAQVGEREETWVTVELADGLRVTFDDDGSYGTLVSLHRAHCPLDGAPATRPYGAEAAVRYDRITGRLAVCPLPTGPHEEVSEHCGCNEVAAFHAWFDGAALLTVLDTLAALPVDDGRFDVREREPLVWRGRLDGAGRALVEELPRDLWPLEGADLPVVAAVELP